MTRGPHYRPMPHPNCPACREWAEEHGADWDESAEFYDLHLDDDGEWVEDE